MPQTYIVQLDVESARSARILAAAERAFARHGFHGASMQHVAAEAGMSAGNLYRTFPSKDAIVRGLTERDRAEMARDFGALAAAPDFLPAVGDMLRKYLVEEPVSRAQLILEIWAEAARNPAIADMCGAMDRDVDTQLTALIAKAQAASPDLRGGEPQLVILIMDTVVAGLLKRRASETGFDGEAEIAVALGIFRAAMNGSLRPYAPEGDRT